jgi:hypothetical protein
VPCRRMMFLGPIPSIRVGEVKPSSFAVGCAVLTGGFPFHGVQLRARKPSLFIGGRSDEDRAIP